MRTIALSIVIALAGPCGSNPDGTDPDDPDAVPFDGACGDNRGLDLLWDIAHNDFTDFREAPSIEAGWVNYSDPGWPLLGFFHPPDWRATPLGDPSSFGVMLTSPDGQSSMTLLYVVAPRADLTSEEIIQTEMQAFGAAGQPVLCRDQAQTVDVVGTDLIMEARAVGGELIMLETTVNFDTGQFGGTPGSAMMATIYRYEGPAETFTANTERVFIPVIWQLLIGDSDNRDTDGDGIYDRNDSFPNDPNRF